MRQSFGYLCGTNDMVEKRHLGPDSDPKKKRCRLQKKKRKGDHFVPTRYRSDVWVLGSVKGCCGHVINVTPPTTSFYVQFIYKNTYTFTYVCTKEVCVKTRYIRLESSIVRQLEAVDFASHLHQPHTPTHVRPTSTQVLTTRPHQRDHSHERGHSERQVR
jgi:hypothetical protein